MLITTFKKSAKKPARHRCFKNYTFVFENSKMLIEGILFLYRNKTTRNLKSALYKINDDYCLVISSFTNNPQFLHLQEFCRRTTLHYITDYLNEYGKILSDKKAINSLGKIFFKGS